MVRRDESDDGHHEARSVERVVAERLGERADLFVPASSHDRIGDLVSLRAPSIDTVASVESIRQRDRSVQRDPAHELAVQEVAGLASDLPDALVLVLPPRGGDVSQGGEETPGDRPEHVDLVRKPVGGIEQLAVHVELTLGPGAVADAHGCAVPPTGQVRELVLGQIALAADPEHDRQLETLSNQRLRRLAGEIEEAVGLVRTGRHPQCLERE